MSYASANATPFLSAVPSDPAIQVVPARQGAGFETWFISANLSDRWGELNFHNQHIKPLDPLIDDLTLLDRLQGQMWEEETMIARKDGEFGILFEIEFCCLESDPDDSRKLAPRSDLHRRLRTAIIWLAQRFPFASLGIPHHSQVYRERSAIWAFVPIDGCNDQQRAALGIALLALACGPDTPSAV